MRMGLDYYAAAASPIPLGFLYIAASTGLTQAALTAAITAGYQGIYLSPTVVYNCAGLTFNGVNNFEIRSTMYGYLRGNQPVGYINFTNTSGDSIAVYASNTIRFNGVAGIGTTTGSIVHFGGGIHGSGGRDCYWRNESNSAGSGITTAAFCFVADTQLQDADNADNDWVNTYIDGAYCAVGVGINDQTHQANDTKMDNLRIAGGVYGVYHLEGGGWTWLNLYDRLVETTCSFYVSATNTGNIAFIGGEPWNNNSGYSLQVGGGYVSIEGRALITHSTPGSGVGISGGFVDFISGRVSSSGMPLVMTGGVANFAASFIGTNFTASGSTGTIYLTGPSGTLTPYSAPNMASFTGTVRNVAYPAVLPWTSGAPTRTGITSTLVTLSYTPPNAVGHYRIVSNVRCSAYVAAIAPTITYNNDGGGSTSGVPSYFNPGTAAGVVSIVATGAYSSVYEFFTDNSGTAITWVVASSTSTYSYSCWLERIA
jgi:hypothetical protein